jgi:2-polyprenyl-3-methyl-5-hydroxy-6-metoxy-1,4-benzoquinol methylase
MNIRKGALEVRKTWGGFRESRVLLTANALGVFDHLSSAKTSEEVAGALGLDSGGTEILLDALTAMGFLKKRRGLLRKSRPTYRNNAMAETFLVGGAPYYQGDILRHADILWQNWSGLDEVVRTGSPAGRARDHGSFIRGMHNLALLRVDEVMKAVELKGVTTALDLGGGPGTYAIALARRGVKVTLFDVPDTVMIAKEMVAEAGVSGVDFMEGDFCTDTIGTGYDLILISQIFHAYAAEENIAILQHCMSALNPGGRVVIQEFLIDTSLTKPLQGALFSINMLVNTQSGRCYAPEEMKQWLTLTGFRAIKKKVMDDHVIMTGAKKA